MKFFEKTIRSCPENVSAYFQPFSFSQSTFCRNKVTEPAKSVESFKFNLIQHKLVSNSSGKDFKFVKSVCLKGGPRPAEKINKIAPQFTPIFPIFSSEKSPEGRKI